MNSNEEYENENQFKEQKRTKSIQYLTLCSSLMVSYIHNLHFISLLSYLLAIALILITLCFLSRKKEYCTSLILCVILSYCTSQMYLGQYYHLQLYLFFISLCLHHFAEYFFILNYHYDLLTFSSFLIDQSKEWGFAISFSIIECLVENYFFHWLKLNIFFIALGLICTLIGHVFRIGALFTGKTNFTHLIAYEKEPEHVLVTSGIYSLSRHPGYFGFYIWSVGTQIMCLNPISIIAFTLVNFAFFRNRILEEEQLLIGFFGQAYIEYMEKVPILIPCKPKYIISI